MSSGNCPVHDHEYEARPEKRQKIEENELLDERTAIEDGGHTAKSNFVPQSAEDTTAAADTGKPGTSSAEQNCGPADDQVAAALKRIGAHIGVAGKFKKASSLLRQLFDGGLLGSEHSEDCFGAISASMADTSRCELPELRREYWKLLKTACDNCELFNSAQKAHLEVLQLWGVLRNELYTDDSFVFSKVLKKLKELVEELPEAGPEDDKVYAEWRKAMGKTESGDVAGRSRGSPKEQKEVLEPSSPCSAEGHNHNGLQTANMSDGSRNPNIYSPGWCLAARREALLDCVESAQKRYNIAWTRTAVDILVAAVHNSRQKFCSVQRPRILEFWRFSRDQKMRRKQGPSAQEEKEQDMTSFELARYEWSQQAVSTRGKVGGSGDHRTEMWLG